MMLKPWSWCPVNLGVGEAYRYSFAEAENLFHADGLAFRVAPASQSRTLGAQSRRLRYGGDSLRAV